MRVTPIGAAGEVTGSCFLVEAGSGTYLVDCGVFQGHKDDESRNWHFPFDPVDIDAVFLTHAHLDHCGRLPYLHAMGFRGPVYATSATCDLAQFILLDAAKIQGEDFRRHSRKSRRAGRQAATPLYDEQDVLHLLRYFQPHPYEKHLTVGGVTAIFHQSGHILGSAAIELREGYTSVLFSGDVGTPARNVVPDPAKAPKCDLVFCESTYGDRLHRSEAESVAELAEAINWAYAEGGNVIIPSFAMERTQDLLFQIRKLREERAVPENTVYLDSPLAINITRVYQHHPQDLDDATRAVFQQHEDPFRFPGLLQTQAPEQSRQINTQDRVVIIAGSGMCQGGRVVHHLRYNLWRQDSAVVFVGYQAAGTRGRRIIEGSGTITIDHEPVEIRARRFTINGFSAHADQTALLDWLSNTGQAHIVLNHGESNASGVLAGLLAAKGRSVEVAKPERVYDTEELLVRR